MAKPVKANFALNELSDDILKGIGQLIAAWGYLQFQLGVIIRVALKLKKDTGRVLTVGMEINVLCGVLRTISKTDHWIKHAGMREAIKKLVKDVQNAVENRNNYAHGVFGYTNETPRRFARLLMKLAQHRVNPEWDVITPDGLAELAIEAENLVVRAQLITIQLKGRGPLPS